MFHIQSFFTRISHYKPSFIMPYRDILLAYLYGRKSRMVYIAYLTLCPVCFISGASGLITKTKSAFINEKGSYFLVHNVSVDFLLSLSCSFYIAQGFRPAG